MSIRSRLLAVAAVLIVAIAGVLPMQAQAETVLNRGFGASPHTLDPHINFGAREAWITGVGLASDKADTKFHDWLQGVYEDIKDKVTAEEIRILKG